MQTLLLSILMLICSTKISNSTQIYFNWAITGHFFYIFVFSIQFMISLIVNKNANDWIRTAGLWCWKQLHHNHCQIQFASNVVIRDGISKCKSSFVTRAPKHEMWIQISKSIWHKFAFEWGPIPTSVTRCLKCLLNIWPLITT